jgi:clan AA aspartic protease
MGLVHADVTLTNEDDLAIQRRGLPIARIREETVRVLVDTGSLYLVLTTDLQSLLELPVRRRERVITADRRRTECDVVGPVLVRFANRATSCDAVVIPGAQEPLLGAIPIEGMDVLIDPRRQVLIVNPESPDLPSSRVVSVRR